MNPALAQIISQALVESGIADEGQATAFVASIQRQHAEQVELARRQMAEVEWSNLVDP